MADSSNTTPVCVCCYFGDDLEGTELWKAVSNVSQEQEEMTRHSLRCLGSSFLLLTADIINPSINRGTVAIERLSVL